MATRCVLFVQCENFHLLVNVMVIFIVVTAEVLEQILRICLHAVGIWDVDKEERNV